MGGTLRKRLEKHQKTTCVYEGEYVHMKRKSKGVWLKLMGGTLRKGLEDHQKSNLCVWREYVHMKGKSKGV